MTKTRRSRDETRKRNTVGHKDEDRRSLRGWLLCEISHFFFLFLPFALTHTHIHTRTTTATFLLTHPATMVGDAPASRYFWYFFFIRMRIECSCDRNQANTNEYRCDTKNVKLVNIYY